MAWFTPPLLVFLLAVLSTTRASAQSLVLKRTLSMASAPGCAIAPPAPISVRRDNAEARRLSAAGQEAALVGDRTAARAAFARAAVLNPADERLAYDLARAHEELGDSLPAIGEYCRYLSLAADGREASDVRARLARLTPPSARTAIERADANFKTGISQFDAARYGAAISAFNDAAQRITAPELLFNRALARARSDDRQAAVRDFEGYLTAVPAATDRAAVESVIALLRRPVYGSGSAFGRGLLPGFGQFYTGRPAKGVVVLALVSGAIVAATYQRTASKTVPYIDPNGVSVPYVIATQDRPYLAAGAAVGVGLTLAAAFEAAHFASTSRAGRARLATYVGSRGELGLQVGMGFGAR